MTFALEKYDKKQLAKLDGDQIIRAVDRSMKDKFLALDDANTELDETIKRKRTYSGGDEATEKKLHMNIVKARRNVSAKIADINNYIEEQRAMFSARGVSPDMVYKWAIVPIGEILPSGIEACRMVKRRFQLEVSDGSGDCDRSVNATLRSPSHSVLKDMKRGKYRDGNRLIMESVCGIDHSEIDGVSD